MRASRRLRIVSRIDFAAAALIATFGAFTVPSPGTIIATGYFALIVTVATGLVLAGITAHRHAGRAEDREYVARLKAMRRHPAGTAMQTGAPSPRLQLVR